VGCSGCQCHSFSSARDTSPGLLHKAYKLKRYGQRTPPPRLLIDESLVLTSCDYRSQNSRGSKKATEFLEDNTLGHMQTFCANYGLYGWSPKLSESPYSKNNSACRLGAITTFKHALSVDSYASEWRLRQLPTWRCLFAFGTISSIISSSDSAAKKNGTLEVFCVLHALTLYIDDGIR
jgi:hypothetical protein